MHDPMKIPNRTSVLVAAAAALVLVSGMCTNAAGQGAQAGTLPVYEVTQAGASGSQVKALCESLGLPGGKVSSVGGVVSYMDSAGNLAIPTRAVTDSAQLEKLKAASRDEMADPSVRFDALDFDGVRKLRVLDSASALKAASAAFAAAGLPLGSATPVAGNTVLSASYTDDSGATVSVEQKIDTRVGYTFSGRNGIPFTGPGARLQVTYDAKGRVTQLYYAWREVKEGREVAIIPEADARYRISKLLPPGARIEMRLVYWCPPFVNVGRNGEALSPATIIPWYSYTGTTETKDPSTGGVTKRTTKERLIPATDDLRYVPMINRLDVSGSGSTQVSGSIGINGGRPAYTVVWTGSNPEVFGNRSREYGYVPLARAVPPEGGAFAPDETVPSNETVSVTAIDANGVATLASLTVPVLARPIVHEKHGESHGEPTYGCESPGEPEEWTQERVGWQLGMSNPGAGSQKFCWLGDSSWPGDYIKPPNPGSLPAKPWIYGDIDYSDWGVNTANIVLVNGDGWPDGFTAMYPGAPQSDYNVNVNLLRPGNPGGTVQMPSSFYSVNYNGSWGTQGPNDRLYWLAGLLCECLDDKDGGGLNPRDRWGAAFGGLHIFTGFASNAAYSAGAFPKAFAENFLGVSGPPQKIKNAWFNASTSTGEGTAAAMGPITTGAVSDLDDYYVGQGTRGPSIAPSKITGWWYLHQ